MRDQNYINKYIESIPSYELRNVMKNLKMN